MTHTPGPWFIQDQKRKDFIPIGPRSRSEDHIVAKVVCLERDNQKLDINISNAYLIAAAPELLYMVAALVGLLEDENGHHFIGEAVREGKALWEKASGETWKDEELEEDDEDNEVEVEVKVEGEQL